MNAKERVMAVLNHQSPDHMPCFGANSTVTYGQMEEAQAFWPEGHEKGETMAKQAMATTMGPMANPSSPSVRFTALDAPTMTTMAKGR